MRNPRTDPQNTPNLISWEEEAEPANKIKK